MNAGVRGIAVMLVAASGCVTASTTLGSSACGRPTTLDSASTSNGSSPYAMASADRGSRRFRRVR